MRHLNSQSQFRHALFALQDAEGYVEALLGMARHQSGARRAPVSLAAVTFSCERRDKTPRNRAALV